MSTTADQRPASLRARLGAAGRPLPRRGAADDNRSYLGYRLLGPVVLALLWQLAAVRTDSLLIPTFTETMAAVADLATQARFWDAFVVSNQALVIGFALALAIGVPVGLMTGRFQTAQKIANVYISVLLVAPMAAIIPLLIMSVGIGLTARVILIVLFACPVMIINCNAGVREIDVKLIDMARSFGASEVQIWRRILLPGALPAFMAGLRISIGRAVEGMVIVELLMVSVGLGGLILNFRSSFEAGLLYAVVVFMIIEALLLVSLARWLENRSAAKRRHSRRRARQPAGEGSQ